VARCAHADARACAPARQDLGDTGGRQPAPLRRHPIAECAAPPAKLKRIVALGDGMFSGGFPKKTFARELAMRGLTLITSEFYT